MRENLGGRQSSERNTLEIYSEYYSPTREGKPVAEG